MNACTMSDRVDARRMKSQQYCNLNIRLRENRKLKTKEIEKLIRWAELVMEDNDFQQNSEEQ